MHQLWAEQTETKDGFSLNISSHTLWVEALTPAEKDHGDIIHTVFNSDPGVTWSYSFYTL